MSQMTTAARRRRWTGVGLLTVISSPSGGGKSTVIRKLRERHPEFLYSVSVTTRPRRTGERSGTHYTFVSESEFRRMIRSNKLIEWAQVHDDYYGTPRANVTRARKRRRIMLFDLDVQGAAQIRASQSDLVTIFLMPPSWKTLKSRLIARGSESSERVQRRLKTAREELKRREEYEYWVTNDQLPSCVSDCEAIIRAEMLRRLRRSVN